MPVRALLIRLRKWRRTLQTGIKVRQQRSLPLYRKAKVFRVYNPTVVWGTLQTVEYAAAVFRQVVDFFEVPDDIDAGVAARSAVYGSPARALITQAIAD